MTPLNGSNEIKRGVYIDGFMYLFGREDFRVVDLKKSENVKTIYDVSEIDNITCDTALEQFWEDAEKIYYFSCIKSQYIKVVYQDGTSENIVTALSNGHATISDLDRFGIDYYIKSKQ